MDHVLAMLSAYALTLVICVVPLVVYHVLRGDD